MDNRYVKLIESVKKPGRYTAGEVNVVRKEWSNTIIKIALAFPDIYDIGMSHLGIKSLYHILNSRKDALCERVFAPWGDLEEGLRASGLPLFSLESGKTLKDFDLVGFSLAHELNYTNVLNILELSCMPILSADRDLSYPLVIAGGPSALNPEPMADFIDIFFIGEAEEGINEIVDRITRLKSGDVIKKKSEYLKEFLDIEGVYVPNFYEATYEGGNFISLASKIEKAPEKISKRVIKDFDNCYYPTAQIVPNVSIVHDRVSLEIMRGCPNRCRFCQATAIYHPRRLRSPDTVMQLAKSAQSLTGYDEISLLSLSTGDYPQILELLEKMILEYKAKEVSISLPSLRVEQITSTLPEVIKRIKKTGLTFAPEVGSKKLKNIINKKIENDVLIDSVRNAFNSGWNRVKLYFMIGIPGEDDADLDAIIDIVERIRSLKCRRKKTVTLSISSLIPKPHTPFQWEGMATRAELARKIDYIKKRIKHRDIKLDTHNIESSFLECILSRGDRRLSEVIRRAFLSGARFDNWSDCFNIKLWLMAFKESGLDLEGYAGEFGYSRPLPWDHIDCGISKESLKQESILAHDYAAIQKLDR